jgi:hypothetical protein
VRSVTWTSLAAYPREPAVPVRAWMEKHLRAITVVLCCVPGAFFPSVGPRRF